MEFKNSLREMRRARKSSQLLLKGNEMQHVASINLSLKMVY